MAFTSNSILWLYATWAAESIVRGNTRKHTKLCFQLEHHGCVIQLPLSAPTQLSPLVLFPHCISVLCFLVNTHTRARADQPTDYTNGVNLCNWSVGNKLHSLLNKGPSVIPHAVQTDHWHPDELSLHLSVVLIVWLRADWIWKVHATIQLGTRFCLQ